LRRMNRPRAMHWFDELTLALARRSPRGAAVKRLGWLTAGAMLSPLTAGSASAGPVPLKSAPPGRRPIQGIRRTRAATQLRPISAGPCTFRFGKSNELAFSVSSSSLRMSVRHDYSVRRASRSAPISVGGSTTIEVMSGTESLLQWKSSYAPSAANAKQPPNASMNLQYGARVRGLSSATMAVHSGIVTGRVNDQPIAPPATRSATSTKATKLASGRDLTVEVNETLANEVNRLVATAKGDLQSCRPKKHHLQHVSERAPAPQAIPRAAFMRGSSFILADAPDLNDCCQNGSGMGSGTAHCATGSQQVMTDLAVCVASAIGSAFFCPPCGVAAVSECYEALGRDLVALYIPGIGACDEVPCGLQADFNTTQFGIRSCDYGSSCCGDNLCCPSGDVCTSQKICCPASAPVGCGDTRPFCCPSGWICAGDQLCCPPGQVVVNGTCQNCPAGQVARNGSCCSNPCGENDCCVNGELCNQQTGTCYYPSFGHATPRPTIPPLQRCPSFGGKVSCAAPNADHTTSYVCCAPNVTCCAGKCCDVGQTCGGTGSSFGCGFWIK